MTKYKKRQTNESIEGYTKVDKIIEISGVLAILYIIYILITNEIASETKTDENYGEPKSIVATEKQKIEIIPSVGPTMVSRISYGEQYAFALIYNNETFECRWCPKMYAGKRRANKKQRKHDIFELCTLKLPFTVAVDRI